MARLGSLRIWSALCRYAGSDGYPIGNLVRNYSDLQVFDAQHIADGPIGRAKLPLRLGRHGNWAEAERFGCMVLTAFSGQSGISVVRAMPRLCVKRRWCVFPRCRIDNIRRMFCVSREETLSAKPDVSFEYMRVL